MTCTDNSIEPLVADYYTGELTPADRSRVETHVATCEACRRSLLLLESLSGRRGKSRYARGHVSPEVVLAYFRNDNSLSPDRKSEIRAHLDVCLECRADWQFLSELTAELEAAAEPKSAPARRPLFRAQWKWLTSPALAWLLVAAAAYPTLSWLKSRVSPELADPATLVAGPWQPLTEATRGSGKMADVFRADPSALVRLTVPQGALPAEMDYRFTLLDLSTNEVREAEIISNLSERGRILLLLNTRGIPDGSYFLQITETSRASGSLQSERGYRFRLVTGP